MTTRGWLPQWVAPAPQRERFPDPLGFQADVDDLAERFLPNITSLTQRARYYSFLCWSLQASGGDRNVIRRHDRRLAECEYELHLNQIMRSRAQIADAGHDLDVPSPTCRFRGVKLLTQHEGDPPRWLRVTTWQIYRSSMRGLGLVERDGRADWKLTDEGEELAWHYGARLRRNSAALPLLCKKGGRRRRERGLLRSVLFGKGPRGETRAFFRASGARDAGTMLQAALRRLTCPPPSDGVARPLWLAGIHELACLGLHALFMHWCRTLPRLDFRYLSGLPMNVEPARSLSVTLDIDDKRKAWRFAWSRLGAAREAIHRHGGRELADTTAGALLDQITLCCGKLPPRSAADVQRVAGMLAARHEEAKGEGLWWRLAGARVEKGDADIRPPALRRHGYRIDAAISLSRDLQ